MVFIKGKALDISGNEIDVRHEAPRDPEGRLAIGYLMPSGDTYVHPLFAFAKQVGAADESIRSAHRGADGKGNEFVSDQKWVYDLAEAADLERKFPGRFVRTIPDEK